MITQNATWRPAPSGRGWIADATCNFTLDDNQRIRIPNTVQDGLIRLNPTMVMIDNMSGIKPVTYAANPVSLTVPAYSRMTFALSKDTQYIDLTCVAGSCTVYFSEELLADDYNQNKVNVDGGAVPLLVSTSDDTLNTVFGTATMTPPSNLQYGDLVILYIIQNSTLGYTPSISSAFTTLVDLTFVTATPSKFKLYVGYFVYNGVTPATPTLYMNNANFCCKWSYQVWRNINPNDPVGTAVSTNGSTTNPFSTSVTSVGVQRTHIAVLGYSSNVQAENNLTDVDNGIMSRVNTTEDLRSGYSGVGSGFPLFMHIKHRNLTENLGSAWSYQKRLGLALNTVQAQFYIKGYGDGSF